ncbi:hypothetical protein MMC10_011016 [Thelotrema lepadinum]|nr:hypothetical protein [Thelotrema lepadinum]
MPDIMGHIPGHFDGLIANFVFASWIRIIHLYFVQDFKLAPKKELEPSSDEKVGKASQTSSGRDAISSPTTSSRRRPNGQATARKDQDGSQRADSAKSFPHMTPFEAVDYLLINHRNISSPYFQKARNTPVYEDLSNRKWFLLSSLLSAGGAYFLLDLLTHQPGLPTQYFTPKHDSLLGRLHEIDATELGCRFVINFNLWVSTALMITYIHSLLAFVGVALGLYQPQDWPPLIGSLADEYSIRNHWGKFWHQIFQVPYVAICGACIDVLLRPLPDLTWLNGRRAPVRRCLVTFLVFMLSMLAHMIQPLGVKGGAPQFWSSCWFFPMQAAGVIFEDAVSWLWGKVTRNRAKRWHGRFEKTVGRMWLLLWFLWCVPPWVYPSLRRGEGGAMMPISLVSMVRSKVKIN